jgi:hypothetical protein
MGLINTANTITITAKLTKKGRERIIEESNSIFSNFMVGDSDANYLTNKSLNSGEIPANSGDLGENNTVNNNIAEGITLKSRLYVNATQQTIKPVAAGSFQLRGEVVNLGETVVSGSNLTFLSLDKTDSVNRPTNYFKSLNLPLTDNRKSFFTKNSNQGGFLDTAFSGLNADNVLLLNIDNSQYGELIDGKSIRGYLPVATGFTTIGTGDTATTITSAITTYTFYSTFVGSGQFSKTSYDNQYKDITNYTQSLFGSGMNVAYIVSDDIQRPNNDNSLSWATGYDTFKPFSQQKKELVRPIADTINSVNADNVIGVAYLDKGMIAITHPDIITGVTEAFNFTGDTDTTTINNSLGFNYMTGSSYNVTIDSVLNNLVQNIVCVLGRDEYYRTQDELKTDTDDVRISEIAITDIAGEILAIGKPDRHIVKKKNDFVIIDVQIII